MSNENILIVEDEENLVEALRYTLAREGYQIMAADNGELGLQMAREHEPA